MTKQLLILLSLASISTVAFGHHGTNTFDHSQEIRISGTVIDLAFVNPHAYVYLEVTEADGATATWRCEMRAATALRRSGWTEEMFLSGRPLRITGSPARSEPHTCYVNTIEFDDGSTADRYSQLGTDETQPAEIRPARLASGAPNISGDWAAEQRVMTDPRGRQGGLVQLSEAQDRSNRGVPPGPGQRPPGRRIAVEPTAAGRQAAAGFDPETDNPRFHCQPTNIFMDWTFDQHVNQIVQTEETITLKYGFMDLERTIFTAQAEHPQNVTPGLAGHSIGRWDDDVLIVDSVGFSPGYLDARRGIMYSEQMHVVERFSYDHENRTLTRRWTAEDPLYFEGEYTGQDVVSIADIPYEPYNCDDRTWQDSEFEELDGAAASDAGEPAERPWWKFW
jgi:hypothetical protein